MPHLTWIDGRTCRINETEFSCAFPAEKGSTLQRFVVLKPKAAIEGYDALLGQLRPKRILELGVFDGGSAALMALLAEPDRLVVVDIEEDPAPVLADFVAHHGMQDIVRCHFGIDQSDRRALDALIDESFGSEPLDLVIDDASHVGAPTRVSFDCAFPLLRPGGKFVLEDWSGSHSLENRLMARIETDPEFADDLAAKLAAGDVAERTPLSLLVIELVLAAGFDPEVVADLEIDRHRVVVTRGSASLDPTTFRLGNAYGRIGSRLVAAVEGVWPP